MTQMIKVETYEEIARDYNNAILWMKSIGVRIESGRALHYAETITHWSENYKGASAQEAREIFPDFSNTTLEIQDFIEIYKSFSKTPINQLGGLIGKLTKAVVGPVSYSNETSSKCQGQEISCLKRSCQRVAIGHYKD